MSSQDTPVTTGQFQLGPFTVVYQPMRDCPIYTRYSIQVEGKEIRSQISYPELADGWLGYSAAIRDKKLTPAEKDAFLARCAELRHKAPAAPTPEAGAAVYYGRHYPRKKEGTPK